jgi:hypothetical protein
MDQAGIAPARIAGLEQGEFTHTAVDSLPRYRAVDAGRVTPLRLAFG